MRATAGALGALLVGLGCRPGAGDRPPPPSSPPAAHSGDPADSGTPLPPLAFSRAPSVHDNPDAGLTAWVDAALDEPATLGIEVEAGGRSWRQEAGPATTHHVLVPGLLADADTLLVVTARAADGRETAPVALVAHAPPLPDGLHAPVVLQAGDPARREPGHTLTVDDALISLIDAEGTVVWYASFGKADEVGVRDGVVWLVGERDHVEAHDLSGRRLVRYATPTALVVPGQVVVDLVAAHHDLAHLPDGHLLTLDVEQRPLLYPTSESDPDAPRRPAWVAGDVVVELAPDGSVVGRWPLLDRLDPQRIGYDAVRGDFWFRFAPWAGDHTRDWGHGNAVSYDPATDLILAGLRHQDAVVAFSRTTGEVAWILAPEANWRAPWSDLVLRPATAGEVPPYHAHGAKFTSRGTVLLFDNGNRRASAFEPPAPGPIPSRALELRPDPARGTWEVVWRFGEDLSPTVFCPSFGDADELPIRDNVLVTFGNPDRGRPQLYEVDRAGEVVWRAELPYAGTWYRAARVTGLFPWEDPAPTPAPPR